MDIFVAIRQVGLNRIYMLAIAQSGNTYHYLNWIPSESGPMVTNYGKIQKEITDLAKFKQHHYEILAEIILTIENDDLSKRWALSRAMRRSFLRLTTNY